MGTFDDRRKGFEEKFKLEQELSFKITARRNRLFGNWAANCLGLSGSEAEEYARSVILSDLQLPGDDDIIGKVEQDLVAKGMTPTNLRAKLDEFAAEAQMQVMSSKLL
jgi:hypothetical protein